MKNEIALNESLTMSSQDIASLVDSRHDKVKQSIERLAAKGVIQLPPMGEVKNSQGQSVSIYHIGKRDSYIIVAQLSPEFTARLVDRWQELENSNQKKLPSNYIEALEALVESEKQKAIMAPKASVYDRIVDANNLYNATQVSQKIGKSAIWLNKQLSQLNVYNRNCKRGRAFQQWFIDKGYGIMRETENGFSQPMFYASGEVWVVEKLSGEGVI